MSQPVIGFFEKNIQCHRKDNIFTPISSVIELENNRISYKQPAGINNANAYFKSYQNPISLSSLTLEFRTNEDDPIILSEALYGGSNSTRYISATFVIYVEELEVEELQNNIHHAPYTNENENNYQW